MYLKRKNRREKVPKYLVQTFELIYLERIKSTYDKYILKSKIYVTNYQ